VNMALRNTRRFALPVGAHRLKIRLSPARLVLPAAQAEGREEVLALRVPGSHFCLPTPGGEGKSCCLLYFFLPSNLPMPLRVIPLSLCFHRSLLWGCFSGFS
jgi:hypothetical protein